MIEAGISSRTATSAALLISFLETENPSTWYVRTPFHYLLSLDAMHATNIYIDRNVEVLMNTLTLILVDFKRDVLN